METIKGIPEFNLVARYESFSKAAKSMGVSKSHISKQVTLLEDRLRVRLFNRTTRRIALTEAGELLYSKSKALLNEMGNILEEVSQTREEPSGVIRISVAGAFAEEHLAKCLSRFSKKYQDIRIELIFNESIVDLIKEGYDLAIRYGELENSSLITKKIAIRQEFICAAPSYIKKFGKPLVPKDLANHQCLINQSEKWWFKEKNKKKSIRVSGPWKTNNPRAIVTAARDGLGIAKLPGAYVFDAINSGKLIPLLEDFKEKEQSIWVLYPQKNYLPTKMRVLIDFISNFFEKNYRETIF